MGKTEGMPIPVSGEQHAWPCGLMASSFPAPRWVGSRKGMGSSPPVRSQGVSLFDTTTPSSAVDDLEIADRCFTLVTSRASTAPCDQDLFR
jgi:hypothetical protein